MHSFENLDVKIFYVSGSKIHFHYAIRTLDEKHTWCPPFKIMTSPTFSNMRSCEEEALWWAKKLGVPCWDINGWNLNDE